MKNVGKYAMVFVLLGSSSLLGLRGMPASKIEQSLAQAQNFERQGLSQLAAAKNRLSNYREQYQEAQGRLPTALDDQNYRIIMEKIQLWRAYISEQRAIIRQAQFFLEIKQQIMQGFADLAKQQLAKTAK